MAAFFGIFMLIGLAFWLGAGFLYALLCTWLHRRTLRLLQVPKHLVAESKRDRFLTFVTFFWAPALNFFCLSIPFLLVVYAVGSYRHFRDIKRQTIVDRPILTRIPRIALSELLVMVFSLGAFPLLGVMYPGAEEGGAAVALLVCAMLVFPLCFASAYLRLDGNGVPLGGTRLLFLFLYPYCICAWHFLIGGTVFFVFAILFVSGGTQRDAEAWLTVWLSLAAVSVLVIILVNIIASRARKEAEAALAVLTETAAPAGVE